ncbi:MAG: hypothetical protein EPO21_19575 [Chloroflexota bacterium]|nr:MAG: hypothetical protein EPO21_19575 [Chloroflexota bacterium]
MQQAPAISRTGISALTLATGLTATVSGAYLALWVLPLRLVFVIFEPALLTGDAWPDLAAYLLSWLAMLAGGVMVYRTLGHKRGRSPLDRSQPYMHAHATIVILTWLWAAVFCLWYVSSLVMESAWLGWAEGSVSAIIACGIASSALALRRTEIYSLRMKLLNKAYRLGQFRIGDLGHFRCHLSSMLRSQRLGRAVASDRNPVELVQPVLR